MNIIIQITVNVLINYIEIDGKKNLLTHIFHRLLRVKRSEYKNVIISFEKYEEFYSKNA
jgi:hypothetical protein